MVTKDMKKRAGLYLADESVIITPALIEQFLNAVKGSGRQMQTVRIYRRSLEDLYNYLPEEKEVTREALEGWRESLKKSGYTDSTINTKLVAVNGLLRHCGAEELVASHERIAIDGAMPEMTRNEYLRFLSRVREFGSEKYYFLIKVFASADINIGELGCLTVEACREGILYMSDERSSPIPGCLREELLRYADRHEIAEGPIFVTRDGNLMDRSNISNSIRRLALRAEMDTEKCCPSALHRLYLTTQKELEERLQPILIQYYENLLNTEQAMVAWQT